MGPSFVCTKGLNRIKSIFCCIKLINIKKNVV